MSSGRIRLSRRSLLTRLSATVAMGVALAALRGALAPDRGAGLVEISAIEAVALMSHVDVSAEAYARGLRERCTTGKTLNAFISFAPDKVLEDARGRDRERRTGAKPGPLFGLPIPIKDSI